MSNNIVLATPTVINTNGFNLTLTGTSTGTGKLITYGNGSVSGTVNGISSSSYTNLLISSSETNSYSSTYTDGIILAGGTLGINSDTGESPPTIYFMGGSSVIKFNNDCSIYNTLCLAANGKIDAYNRSGSLYGLIGGTGGMTFQGSGSITLNSQSHTYTGSTTINLGTTLYANHENAIACSSSVAVNGTFDLSANSQTLNDVSGGGIIKDSSGGNPLTLNAVTGSTFSGTLDSSLGSVKIQGWAPLILTNDNSNYSNGITIQNGILKISSVSAIGTGSLTFTNGILQAGANLTFTNEIALNGNLILDTGGHTIDLSGASISGDGNITVLGGGSVTFASDYGGSVYYKSDTTASEISGIPLAGTFGEVNGDTVIIGTTTFNASNFSGGNIYFYSGTPLTLQPTADNLTITNNIILMTTGTIDLNGKILQIDGTISGPSHLTISTGVSSGTLTLNNVNTYTGGTTLMSNSTLCIYDALNLGTGAVALNGGTLQAGCDITLDKNITLSANSSIDTQGHNVILSGNINLGAYSLSVLNGGSLKILGTVTGTGTVKLQGSTLKFPENTTFTKNITLSANSTLDTQGYNIILSGNINLGTYSLSVLNGGSLTTTGTIQSTGSGVHQIIISEGCTFTPEGSYIDNGGNSTDDMITLFGSLIIQNQNYVPQHIRLGSGGHVTIQSNCTLAEIRAS